MSNNEWTTEIPKQAEAGETGVAAIVVADYFKVRREENRAYIQKLYAAEKEDNTVDKLPYKKHARADNHSAYYAGRAAADKISLHKQIK